MSKSSVQLRVVASNDDVSFRNNASRKFKETMTEHLRAHTDGTNVNSSTLLTNDYLNHFNEIIMLLELVPAAPAQFATELSDWRHETYEEHFTHSGFRDKDLAIACYRNAPEEVRRAFDSAIADLEQEMVMLLKQVQDKIANGDTEGLSKLCCGAVPRLQELIEITAGIINGVDSDRPGSGKKPGKKTGKHDQQSAVDALFD